MTVALFTLSLIIAVSGDFVDDKSESIQHKQSETFNMTPEMPLEELIKKPPMIEHGHVDEKEHSIPEINAKSGVDEQLFQGDILLTKSQAEEVINDIEEEIGGGNIRETGRIKRQAVADLNQLWPGGQVNYYFDGSLGDDLKRIFLKGAEMWEKDSCVRFIYNTEAVNRISVQAGEGCLSPIGRAGGVQRISLGKGCAYVEIVAHEIGHALGFYHTMSRSDRDLFITMNMANVQPYYRDKLLGEGTQTFDLPYDYGSIMHYGESSVSIDKKQPAMLPLEYDYKYTLGSPFVSFVDLAMVNRLYRCERLCNPAQSVVCEMRGFPNPRNCSKCVCPGGYGGDRCTERPENGCGSTVHASPNWTTLKSIMGDVSKGVKEDFTTCTYWIESPHGTEIEVELLSFSDYFVYDGCVYGGVEIKTNKDQRLTGYRFCSSSAARTVLRSYTNRVPIITWNRYFRFEMTLRYRHVPASMPRTTSRTVRPFPTTTESPHSDYFWIFGQAARQCVDHPVCSYYSAKDCYYQPMSERVRIYCPRTCYTCFTRQIANTAFKALFPHMSKK